MALMVLGEGITRDLEKWCVKAVVRKDNGEAVRNLLALENGLQDRTQRGAIELFNPVRSTRSKGIVGIANMNEKCMIDSSELWNQA